MAETEVTVSTIPSPGSEPTKRAFPNVNTPPSRPTSQYPWPLPVATIPTTGWAKRTLPVEPKNLASPNVNTPPSDATSQYPFRPGRGHPDDGLVQSDVAVEPKNLASPKVKTPPSLAKSQ